MIETEMTVEQVKAIMAEEIRTRTLLCLRLVEAARPAARVLKDLGHASTADPILEILFQLDAVADRTASALQEAGPDVFLDLVKELS